MSNTASSRPAERRRVSCEPIDIWPAFEAEWAELAEAAAVTHFVENDWVGTWLEVYGDALGTRVWTYRFGDQLRAACLLTERREWRGPIPLRCLFLNTAGEDPGEGVCAEYNQVLCRPGHEEESARELGAVIRMSGVDELVAHGLTPRSLELLRRALPGWEQDLRWSEDPYVDLAQLRVNGSDYRRTALSSNSRGQVNRTLNAYAKLGEVRTEIATTWERAHAMLDELIALHQTTWRDRSETGAFASPRYRRFHKDLVSRLSSRNGVQLLRVTAGGTPVGVLYNLISAGRVFFYQSGLNYRSESKYRPGLATHVCAIERCLELGFSEYHFLAGEVTPPRYKKSLATHDRALVWVRLRRPGLKTRFIDQLRTVKRKLQPNA
jgi:CelD/BcsL family acetyltransferase involved in cellulose biosynthesis